MCKNNETANRLLIRVNEANVHADWVKALRCAEDYLAYVRSLYVIDTITANLEKLDSDEQTKEESKE